MERGPPATAVHQIRKAVADLRRRIPGGAGLLVTDGPGYRAAVADEQVDLSRFTRLTGEAREQFAAGAAAQAADLLRRALALWRGPVLAGSGGATLAAAATALDERRLAAAEQLFQLRLDQGESRELVVELRELIVEHPLRETLRGQLMLALYRSGRAAEALEEFGRVRDVLVAELGIDPGPRLTKLYEAILRDSDELTGPEPQQPAAVPQTPVTAPSLSTLPYDLSDFTGREEELRTLLRHAAEPCDGTRIVAVDGMGGSGKTSLAVRAAHQLADQYPDGRLCFDLRGYSPARNPCSRPPCSAPCCAPSASPTSASPRTRAAGRPCGGPPSRAAGCCSCSTTRATPRRYGRCCRPLPAVWSWSPAGRG